MSPVSLEPLVPALVEPLLVELDEAVPVGLPLEELDELPVVALVLDVVELEELLVPLAALVLAALDGPLPLPLPA
jgi:hypothetical protein